MKNQTGDRQSSAKARLKSCGTAIAVMTLAAGITGFGAAGFSQTLPGAVADRTGPETAVRLVTGKDLNETIAKGMTPQTLYSQIVLAKRDAYAIIITGRDKSGQSEIHDNWNDHFFIQEGEAKFIVGGTAPDAKVREPGEKRGTAVVGGETKIVRAGDYLFIPAGLPHQMVMDSGRKVKFIAFKTRK